VYENVSKCRTLESILKNKNEVHDEYRRRIHYGDVSDSVTELNILSVF
jgi:hypothetical protein